MSQHEYTVCYLECDYCHRKGDPYNQETTFKEDEIRKNRGHDICDKCEEEGIYFIDADIASPDHLVNFEEPPENKPFPDYAAVIWNDMGDGAGEQIFKKWIWKD